MWNWSDLIKWAKHGATDDPQKNWVNDYPNGFLFLALIVFALIFVSFIKPLLGL
jgi:hypothetical protein